MSPWHVDAKPMGIAYLLTKPLQMHAATKAMHVSILSVYTPL